MHCEHTGSRPSHFIFLRRQDSQARQTRRRWRGTRMAYSEGSTEIDFCLGLAAMGGMRGEERGGMGNGLFGPGYFRVGMAM